MTSLVRFSNSAGVDLEHEKALHRVRVVAARAKAEIDAASAVYDSAAQYRNSRTTLWLRDRYFRR